MPARVESPSPDGRDPAAIKGVTTAANGGIEDIGGSQVGPMIHVQLRDSFVRAKRQGQRPSLPEELLYDDKGLEIWAGLIYQPEYYQARDETTILKSHGEEIARWLSPGTTIIDLGAGDTRKVMHLLAKLDALHVPATYLALDISRTSLKENIDRMYGHYTNVQCVGLWGSFANLQTWVPQIAGPRLFLSLGSVLFNDARDKAVKHLRTWAQQMRKNDLLLAGMDGHTMPDDEVKIWSSYHGKGGEGVWGAFWQNGFKRANEVTGTNYFKKEDWEIHGKIERNPVSHQFLFRARKDIHMRELDNIKFRKGEEFDWFDAHKNGESDVRAMCAETGLEVVKVLRIRGSRMTQYLIRRQMTS